MNETLYVITPIFNPRRFTSRIKLYNQFAKYMQDCGVKLITVEVAFADRPFEVTNHYNPYHLQLRSPVELWHKERAINLGIEHLKKLHPEVKKVAWIDADVHFSNPNWVTDTLYALDHYHVVQMFSQATNLGPKHEILDKFEGAFAHWRNRKPPVHVCDYPLAELGGGHPGLAWAATINILEKLGGLIDRCVHGSGDSHMANALRGDVHTYYLKRETSEAFKKMLDDWQALCDKFVKRNVGHIEGVCNHYWHGAYQKRGYNTRWDVICHHEYDPFVDIEYDDNGLYKFTGNKPDFEQDLRLSMIARNDDDNVITYDPAKIVKEGDKIGNKVLRRVSAGFAEKNPDLGLKEGDLWPM